MKRFVVIPGALILSGAVSLSLGAPFCHAANKPKPAKPTGDSRGVKQVGKQIYTFPGAPESSRLFGATGVAAYVVSSQGTNRGFYVSEIAQGGYAWQIGVAEGDVLLSLNGRVTSSARDVERILAATPTGRLRVVFAREAEGMLACYSPTALYTNRGDQAQSAQPAPSMVATSVSADTSGHATSCPLNGDTITSLEAYGLALVNADRQANGNLPALAANAALGGVARAYAQDMARTHHFSHVDPDGRNPAARAAAAGVTAFVWENIAFRSGYFPARVAVAQCQKAMMDEPPDDPHNHRGNILNPNHVCAGIGVARASDGIIYLVQEFSNTSP